MLGPNSTQDRTRPLAVVLGDIDMLRPLVMAGIPSAVCAGTHALPRYSRFARKLIDWYDPWKQPERLVESLIDFASGLTQRPILFYESDADLLMISRNRQRLSEYYCFIVPDSELTEILVDKLRFQELASELDLPVPPAVLVSAGADLRSAIDDLKFPLIVKPVTRKVSAWSPIAGLSKAIRVDTAGQLSNLRASLEENEIEYLVQELVEGDESSIESYHVYVDSSGEIAGEFTGKKIRTYPREFGQSCALTISDAPDVAELGQDLVKKLNFRGLAKFDFKRAPDGGLYLLEVNPRFSLWHHLGAAAGVNIPLLVYCDLAGIARPETGSAKVGATWCRMWQDIFAARKEGVAFLTWLRWALSCEAKAGLAWDDPLPIFGAMLGRGLAKLPLKKDRINH